MLIDPVIAESRLSDRKRKNYNFHKVAEDSIQRMLNVLQPNSYVQPHKHESPDKREAFIIIEGRMLVVIFNENGDVLESVVLDKNNGVYGYEVDVATYHTIIALEEDTVVYEVKDGPYLPMDDKNFAEWAPTEAEVEEAQEYMAELKKKVLSLSCR